MPNLQIIISALNKASQDINKVKSEIKGVGDSGKEAQGGVKGFGASLTSMMGTAALVTGAVVAVGAAIKQVQDAAKEGAAFQRMEDASGSLARSLDADMGVIMDALREASLGMVSDFDLMQSASRAMMLGVSADSGELAQLMEVAALRGRAMGLSTTQAFNDIVTGIGRASPLILDNLGIVIDAESRYKAYAEAIGKTSEELTKAEKTQALLNGVLESSAGLLEETGGLTVDNAGKWEQMAAAQKNYFDNTKSDIADATSWWAEFWTGVFNRGIESQEAMNKAQEYGISLYKETPPAINAVTEETNNLIGSYDRYGRYVSAASDNLGRQRYETDLVKKSNEELNAEFIAYEATIDMTAESLIAQSIAAKRAEEANKNAAVAQQAVTDATNDAESAMRSYSESLLFKIASEGLSADAAYDLAVAMGLVDKNTVAATKQVNVYKDLLDAGLITQAQYNLLVRDLADDIENLPEGKTLEIDDNIDDVLADLAELETWKMKPIPIKLNLDTSAVDNYHPPTMTGTVTYLPVHGMNNAVGGAVQGGQPYTWQEYGYRGELFVPSADGFIMSRADAERALSKALTGQNSGDGIDADAVGKAVADALIRAGGGKGGNVYNLTMPTSSNPADVRTAFELMEAWA
jgi:hypothetical protein